MKITEKQIVTTQDIIIFDYTYDEVHQRILETHADVYEDQLGFIKEQLLAGDQNAVDQECNTLHALIFDEDGRFDVTDLKQDYFSFWGFEVMERHYEATKGMDFLGRKHFTEGILDKWVINIKGLPHGNFSVKDCDW